MDYLEHLKKRLDDNEAFVPGRLGNKSHVRDFARMVGVATPSLYYEGPLETLSLSSLPMEFVLKPSFASTSIGVLLLQRVAPSLYRDIITEEELTDTDIQAKCETTSLRFLGDKKQGIFIVEQLLRDPNGITPPSDIRFYAFQGIVGMIMKEDHLSQGPTKAMYFDGNFTPFPDIEHRYGVADKMRSIETIVEAERPKNWKALLTVARRISVAVPTAFVRVDLYDTGNTVILGELTFYPGTFYYRNRKIMSNSESERLGHLWDRAEERLNGSHDSVSLRDPFK